MLLGFIVGVIVTYTFAYHRANYVADKIQLRIDREKKDLEAEIERLKRELASK